MFALAALAALPGCYSFAQLRESRRIVSDGVAAELHVWTHHSAGPLAEGSDDPSPVAPLSLAGMALVTYPLNVVYSTVASVEAMWDPEFGIRFGPIGALVGIAVPGYTCLPPLMRVPSPIEPVQSELPRAQFDLLLARIASGDGVSAYEEIVLGGPTRADRDRITSVSLAAVQPIPAEEPAAVCPIRR